jgi:hypothetical protein
MDDVTTILDDYSLVTPSTSWMSSMRGSYLFTVACRGLFTRNVGASIYFGPSLEGSSTLNPKVHCLVYSGASATIIADPFDHY